jgi:cation:H+ antiporter
MIDLILVGTGLALLFFGGDFLVRGAVALAHRLGVSTLVIAITVVAFGTSLPELIVSLNAALQGAPSIAIGNVVGSNIANVLLVLGLPAIIAPLVSQRSIGRDTAIMIGASLLFVALAFTGEFRWPHGALFVVLLAAFLGYSLWIATRDKAAAETYEEELDSFESAARSGLLLAGFIIGGLVALVVGSRLLVIGAVNIATALGVSEAVIGLTLVAFGTSLPELVTSLVAVVRRHGDVAIGNVLGSNLFNILGVMGITAIVVPIPVPGQILRFDVWVMLAAAVILLPFVLHWIRLGRAMGLLFLAAYIAYIAAQFHGMSGVAA